MTPCARKRYWPHEYAATAAARALGQTAYKCRDCNGWHLTKQPESVRRFYEDRERKLSQEAHTMGKGKDPTITFRVLQVNPASSSEQTELNDDGGVKSIQRTVFEDARLGVTSVDSGREEGSGRLVSGELVISAPEGTFQTGQVLEGTLSVKTEDAGATVPTTAAEGSTLRQNREEAERGRKPDGSLGDAPKDKGGSRTRSSRSRKRSGRATSPAETDRRAGSANRP